MTRSDLTLLALAVLFAGMLLYVPANAQVSAMSMKDACETVAGTAKSSAKGSDYQKGYCTGVVDAIGSLGSPSSIVPICRPEKSTTRQAVLIVLKYMNDNPNQLHEAFIQIVGWALSEAWPCPKK